MLCVSYQGQTRYMGLFDTEDQAKSANIIVRGKFRTTRELRLTKNEIKKEVETVKRDAREAVGMGTSRGKVKGKPKKIKSETLENRASRDAGRTSSHERVRSFPKHVRLCFGGHFIHNFRFVLVITL